MALTRDELHRLASGLPKYTEVAAEQVANFADYRFFYHLPEADSIIHRIGQITINSQRIVCQSWSPPNPEKTVLIVHGLYEHAGIYSKLIRYYLSRNQRVCLFDTVGHGLSEGHPAAVKSFQIYLDILDAVSAMFVDVHQCQLNAIGQSTGGGVLIHHQLRQPKSRFQQVITLGPLLRCSGWWWVTRLNRVLRLFLEDIPRNFSASSHDQGFVTFLKDADPLQSQTLSLQWITAMVAAEAQFYEYSGSENPLIVIQGDADEVVDWRYNLPQFKQRFKQLEVSMIPGAMHQLAFEADNYYQQVCDVLDGYN